MKIEEVKCCQECSILDKRLDSEIKCITEQEEFKTLCLNKIVLEASCIRHQRYQKKFNNIKTFSNK